MEAIELIQLTEIRTVHPANDVSRAQMIADQKKIKEQAKISLEAGKQEGIKEVVEDLIETWDAAPHNKTIVTLWKCLEKWQGKLKEWGLKEV